MVFGSLMKVLIVPNGQPESVNQWTDNTMAKKDKNPKQLLRKLKIEHHEQH